MNAEPGRPPRAGLRGILEDVRGLNRAALVILLSVPILLTLLDYYGLPWHYPTQQARRPALTDSEMRPIDPPFASVLERVELPGPEGVRPYMWFSLSSLVLLALIPLLVGWLLAGRSPRALGLKLKGTGHDAWTYLILFVIVFPLIYLFSLSESFQRTYPFFRPPGGTLGQDFLVFEVFYCLQFFAVEFFFRGFIVLGLKRALGWASVLVMLAPYCMVHYYKPMPEALGAIGGGLVLGTLAWRTGTILYGWALHYAIALSMDLLALHHRGLL